MGTLLITGGVVCGVIVFGMVVLAVLIIAAVIGFNAWKNGVRFRDGIDKQEVEIIGKSIEKVLMDEAKRNLQKLQGSIEDTIRNNSSSS